MPASGKACAPLSPPFRQESPAQCATRPHTQICALSEQAAIDIVIVSCRVVPPCARPPQHLSAPSSAARPPHPAQVARHRAGAMLRSSGDTSPDAITKWLTMSCAECDIIKFAARVAQQRGTLSSLQQPDMANLNTVVRLGRPPPPCCTPVALLR